MTSLTESFSLSKHTPLSEKEQNEREILQWRLMLEWNSTGQCLKEYIILRLDIKQKRKHCKFRILKINFLIRIQNYNVSVKVPIWKQLLAF